MTGFKGSLMIATAVLFLTGGTLVFAGGQSEAPVQPGTGSAPSTAQPTVGTTVMTFTGQVHFVNLIRPTIKSGSTEYELLVPRYGIYQSGVTDGQTITVKAYKVEGGSWGVYYGKAQAADTTPKLLVSSATVAGKTYDLQDWADHFKLALKYRATYGPHYGFRGPGYGPMMAYGHRGRGDFGHGPRGWSDRDFGRGPMNGPGYGPMFGPGNGPYGPGMGYGYRYDAPQSNRGQ